MASSSSSPSRTWKYDVFPSFSGEDVRKSFLGHFLEKLQGKSIITFIDNRIERSRSMELELLLAIRQSRISIVVFSKKYASSTWCLNELAEIHDCHEESDQMVIPIFYEVDPSHVRKQTGEFGNAFETTCEGKSEDRIGRWKNALAKLAGLAGYDSQNWSGEAEAIELISKDVLNKLLLTPSDDFRDFVGIEAHIESIMDSKLRLESGGVRMVGILGPSGIGKTTIARALFNRISSQFDHRAFVSYKVAVQEKKIADFGMKLSWAKHFLSEILCQKDIKIESLGAVEQRLKHRKVLIVLDDVDEIELLETLVGRTGWFGFGSRIIVVTQDRALLKSHEIELIHEVEFPSEHLALQMFCQSAFGKTSPPDGFMELAAEVANLSGDLPLGLNVLGSSLRGKDKDHWVEMMPRLRNGLNGKIQKTLRVSYDGLDEKDDQDIFLYIACLFNGERVKYIKNLLGGSVTIGLQVLADKSLIRLTPPCNTVHLHPLLEKLGREIVRAESITNPGKRRFLVDAKDISDVFEGYTGTDSVLAIHCNTSDIEEPFFVNEKSFKQMRNLQFIKVYNERIQYRYTCEVCWARKLGEVRLNLPQGLIYLPRKLKLLHWDEYPAKYIPSSFSGEYLVELRLTNSRLEKLWEGTQPLRSIKVMNIAGSRDLKEIPDLSNATNLEILKLCNCTSLVTLPSSIRNLKKLIRLRMSGCSKLEVLPTDVNLESLDYLDLRDCSRLKSFPRISRNISRLNLDGIAMEEDDCLWIGNLLGLTLLDWVNCPLRCMPSNFNPEHLTELIMNKSKLEKLWEGYQSLRSLMLMDFKNSKNLKEMPDLSTASNLFDLDLSECESLKEIPDLSNAIPLFKMNLSGCKSLKGIPNLSNARNLQWLDMSGCTSLSLCGCSRLTSFPQLSMSINELNLSETAIEEVPSWIENIAGLTRLEMRGCPKLRTISATIWNLKYLNHVDFTDCGGITSVSDTSLVKTVAELHAESVENHPMDKYLSWSFSNTEFLFCDCFNLDRDAQEFILQSDSRFVVLPGKEVPTYFTHQTHGSSLTIPLPQSSLSQNHLRFTACVDFGDKFDVHWKFRGVTGMCTIDPGKYFCKMDHLVVFHFGFCPQEEVHGPPSQLDCNNVEFMFKFRNTGFLYCTEDLQTIPIFHGKIKKCGVRSLNASPSLVANDRSSKTEYTDQSSRESDEEAERCKKRMRMTVETSEENSNSLCGQTAGNSGSIALNLELSLGLIGPSAQVASRSKVPSPSISPRNFHGDEASLNLSFSF